MFKIWVLGVCHPLGWGIVKPTIVHWVMLGNDVKFSTSSYNSLTTEITSMKKFEASAGILNEIN